MRILQRTISQLKYSKEPKESLGKTSYPKQIIWDVNPIGFGVRVYPSGKKSFVYQYRTAEGQKRLADLGAVGELTLDQAREKAQKWAALILDGKDPLHERQKVRSGTLMSDFCLAYIERHAKPHKKTWKEDERRNKLYILPAFGSKQVQHVKRSDVARLHGNIGKTKPYMANRVKEQLSKMFELAKTWGYVDDSLVNPTKGIPDFHEEQRSDYIKPEHWPIVAQCIEMEENEIAKCAIWMYVFTGKRRNEILEARWQDIDATARTLKIAPLGTREKADKRARRGSTKNSEVEFIPLSDEAWAIIERAKKFRIVGNPYIFPSEKVRGGHFVNVRKPWTRIQKAAAKKGAEGIKNVPIHGLRHTVAVWLTNLSDADLGLVRKLLNHKSLQATKIYAKYKTSTVQKALERHGAMVMKMSKIENDEKAVQIHSDA